MLKESNNFQALFPNAALEELPGPAAGGCTAATSLCAPSAPAGYPRSLSTGGFSAGRAPRLPPDAFLVVKSRCRTSDERSAFGFTLTNQPPLVFSSPESQVSEGQTACKAPISPRFLADFMGNASKGRSSLLPCDPARRAQDKAPVRRVATRGRIGAVGFLQVTASLPWGWQKGDGH